MDGSASNSAAVYKPVGVTAETPNSEVLIAFAGTFAMEAHKKNILDVIDRYENLRKHDPRYPTADYLNIIRRHFLS